MVPPFCVMRKLPSGRKATAHAPVSPVAIVSTLNGGDGLAGAGASVWPGKAGVGSGDCARSEADRTRANDSDVSRGHVMAAHPSTGTLTRRTNLRDSRPPSPSVL